MAIRLRGFAPLVFASLALAAPAAYAQHAPTYRAGDLEIAEPWTRATPGGASVAGGFMRITNRGAQPDRLVGGDFTLSKAFEVHEMSIDNGVMKMRPVEGGLEIKPGQTVELKPGGYHVMMIGLASPIKQGAPIKGALQFEKAGKVDIEFFVAPIGAASPGEHKH